MDVAPEAAPAVLRVDSVHKRFGGTVALDGVDLEVRPGEIHALVGENGAGKSTLIKILAGVHEADAGRVLVDGEERDPGAHGGLPFGFIHQDLGLVGSLDVAENIALVAGYPRRGRLVDWGGARRQARALLQLMDSNIDPRSLVAPLSSADRSIVAICRALSQDVRLLVLDEPTASLSQPDVARLFAALGRLRDHRIAVLYVTHRLEELLRIADRVTVFRNGQTVLTSDVADADPAGLVHAMIGYELPELETVAEADATGTAVSVRGLASAHSGPVSFDVNRGEIVALAGLRGSGNEETARLLIGDEKRLSGDVLLEDGDYAPRSARDALARGIGFVSRMRTDESLAPGLTVRENLFLNPTLSRSPQLSKWRQAWLGGSSERAAYARLATEFGIRPGDASEVLIEHLSGGNQQKVVLARWFAAGSKLLVLEDPTSGVDVGARTAIYRLIFDFVAAGAAVVLVSSDFEEVVRLAHRALVFQGGVICGTLSGHALTVDGLTTLATRSNARPVPSTRERGG